MSKTEGQKLEEKLLYKTKNISKERPSDIERALEFSEGYKEFLDNSKIERECVNYSQKLAMDNGYTEFVRGKKYKAGDKVYFINRGKNIILTTFGKKGVADGIHFNIAHIDSPRLDLKPSPLYEKDELAYFKTHYYGGIRKYQWGVTPLAIHGRVMLSDGSHIDLNLGENVGDPVFVVSDLLPHLSKRQDERKLSEGLRGEELNIILGSTTITDEEVKAGLS